MPIVWEQELSKYTHTLTKTQTETADRNCIRKENTSQCLQKYRKFIFCLIFSLTSTIYLLVFSLSNPISP